MINSQKARKTPGHLLSIGFLSACTGLNTLQVLLDGYASADLTAVVAGGDFLL